MQYILSEEEYKTLKGSQMRVMSESDINLYMRRLPHFGPTIIGVMLQYFKEDGIVLSKAAEQH